MRPAYLFYEVALCLPMPEVQKRNLAARIHKDFRGSFLAK
jgi:hypothetical protein